MNHFRRSGRTLILSVIAAWPASTFAQVPVQVVTPPPPTSRIVETNAPIVQGPTTSTVVTSPAAPTIGSHQIDRFEAIRQLQADLKSDPNNLANWTILGELAHEVALDIPQGQDDAYYKLSRESYERASQLDPTNNGLRAAVQFAREQEANAAAFDNRRRQGVSTYLEARRREMAATGVNPTVMVYENSPPVVAATPAQPAVVGQPAATGYPTATYRPYYNAQTQQPYGYNQYSTSYVTPSTTGTQSVVPMTLRQFRVFNATPVTGTTIYPR